MGGGCRVEGQNAFQQFCLGRLRRLFADGDGVIVLQGQHVIPQGVDLLLQLVGAGFGQLFHRVQAQKQQQYVPHGGAQLVAAQGDVGFLDPVVQGHDGGAVLGGPLFLGAFAHGLLQAAVAAGLGKGQQIGLDERIVVHELIVQAHFRGIVVFGHHAGDVAGHAAGLEVFQHADALVALLHIEAAHVLKAADGVTDALVHVGHAKGDPLGAELAL